MQIQLFAILPLFYVLWGGEAAGIEVSVSEDKIHGSIAEITIKAAPGVDADDIKAKADDILARYTIKYRLEIS